MIAFPNCKINLGLNVIRRREDNYHDIETVFYPLDLTDVLEINAAENNKTEFTVTGLPVEIENNICSKAYDLLKKDYPGLPFIKMHLHKSIPAGAGLGGGSADGAFTLKLLNQKFTMDITTSQLENYALQLGSDCPFFLHNAPCLATGRGQFVEPLNIDISSYKILLVNPGIHINTSWAFSRIKPQLSLTPIMEIITQPVESWKENLINDFELPVFEIYPEIKNIKDTLYKLGAIYASLSGSGSTVYGIFENDFLLNTTFDKSYFSRTIKLK